MSSVRITRSKDKNNPNNPKGIITIEINGEEIGFPPIGQTKIVNLEVKAAGNRLEYTKGD